VTSEAVRSISAAGSNLRWYMDRPGTDPLAHGGYLVSWERCRLQGSAGRVFCGRNRGSREWSVRPACAYVGRSGTFLGFKPRCGRTFSGLPRMPWSSRLCLGARSRNQDWSRCQLRCC